MGGGHSKAHKTMYPFRGDPFKGIVNTLWGTCGGNPCTKGLIEVTASSTGPRSIFQLDELFVQRDEEGEWSSNNEPASYILLDFKTHKVDITNYSLQTYSGKENGMHLKSWKVEVSDDRSRWLTIDEVKDSSALNKPLAVVTRPAKLAGYKRYVMFTMKGKNWFGTDTMTLKRIEFFGNVQ